MKYLLPLSQLFHLHEWVEIDVFKFKHYVAVNESGFRYYKCSCGKHVREKANKLMQASLDQIETFMSKETPQ